MGLCIRKEKEDAGSIKHHQEGQSGKPKAPSPAPKEVKVGKANQQENNASASPAKNANNKDSPKGGFSRKKLEQLFAKYKDEGDSDPVIGPDGIEKFCTDLEISPEDVLVVVMAYHLNAQEMGYFTQAEFLDGFEKLGLDSIEAIKGHLPRFRAELDEQEQFKTIYRFAFNFAREDPAKKVVDMEIASGMLLLVMGEKYPLSKNFVDFLKVQDSYKALNMDQWMSFYEFCEVVTNDFSNYDENSAWPCIIDEWVEWRKKGDNPPEEED